MSSNIYQRIQDRDRYTQRLEDIVNFVDSFLDVNEKLNAADSAIGDFVPVIPIKEYLKTTFPSVEIVDDGDSSFEEPPPPYSYSVSNSEELLYPCIHPTDKHEHDHSDSGITSPPTPTPKSQKKRSRFRECFVFWNPSEFNVVIEETVESDCGIGKAQSTAEEPVPEYSPKNPDPNNAESAGASESKVPAEPIIPESKEPKLENGPGDEEDTDPPSIRQLTAEQKEELMEFFCVSALQPGIRSAEVKSHIGTVFRYIKVFGEYMDSVNCLCDSVNDTLDIYRSRVAEWNKRVNRSRPLASGCRRRQWGR